MIAVRAKAHVGMTLYFRVLSHVRRAPGYFQQSPLWMVYESIQKSSGAATYQLGTAILQANKNAAICGFYVTTPSRINNV